MERVLIFFLWVYVTNVLSDSWDPPAVCLLPHKKGNCFAKIQSYFYNKDTGKCEKFIFSGCGGNNNRFMTKARCMKSCSCHMPLKVGSCNAGTEKWFYNPAKGCCEKSIHGECGGNGNQFDSYNECKEICAFTSQAPVKPLGTNWGTGNLLKVRLAEINKPQNYVQKFGGAKTIWLHNEDIHENKLNPDTKQVLKAISKARKVQVPGVQTRSQLQLMSSQPYMVSSGRSRSVLIKENEMIPHKGNWQTGANSKVVLQRRGRRIGDNVSSGVAIPVGGSTGLLGTVTPGRLEVIPSSGTLGIRKSDIFPVTGMVSGKSKIIGDGMQHMLGAGLARNFDGSTSMMQNPGNPFATEARTSIMSRSNANIHPGTGNSLGSWSKATSGWTNRSPLSSSMTAGNQGLVSRGSLHPYITPRETYESNVAPRPGMLNMDQVGDNFESMGSFGGGGMGMNGIMDKHRLYNQGGWHMPV